MRARALWILALGILGSGSLRGAEPDEPEKRIVALAEKYAGKITRDDKAPGKPLVKLDLSGTKVENADLADLKGCASLRILELRGTGISLNGVKHIVSLTDLEELDLAGTKVTDSALALLATMPNLRVLRVDGTSVGNAGMKHLTRMAGLRELGVNSGQIDAEAIPLFAEMRGLKKLHLAFCRLKSPQLEGLKGLELESLNLRETGIDLNALPHLTGMTTLRILSLDGIKAAPSASLKDLGKLTGLEELYLNGTTASLRGKSSAFLTDLKKLKKLHVMQTDLDNEGLANLAELTAFQDLAINQTPVSDQGLRHLEGLTNLTRLTLTGTQITSKGLRHLEGLSKLRELFIYNETLNDEGLRHLEELSELEILGVRGLGITDEGLKRLKGLKKLRDLRLAQTSVTDAGVASLKQLLPDVKIQRQ